MHAHAHAHPHFLFFQKIASTFLHINIQYTEGGSKVQILYANKRKYLLRQTDRELQIVNE